MTAARSTPRASRARRSSRASVSAGGRAPAGRIPRFQLRRRRRPGAAARHRCRHPVRTVRRPRGRRGRAPGRGEDVAASVNVPLAMAAGGGSVRVALPTGKTLDVAIPAGVEDGKQIRLRGQGRPGARNAPAGDAIVTIHYAPHPLFKVEGRDLRLELPITLYEAVLGAQGAGPRCRARWRSRSRQEPAADGCCGCAARVCRPPANACRRLAGDAAHRDAGRRGRRPGGADAALARREALRSPRMAA